MAINLCWAFCFGGGGAGGVPDFVKVFSAFLSFFRACFWFSIWCSAFSIRCSWFPIRCSRLSIRWSGFLKGVPGCSRFSGSCSGIFRVF